MFKLFTLKILFFLQINKCLWKTILLTHPIPDHVNLLVVGWTGNHQWCCYQNLQYELLLYNCCYVFQAEFSSILINNLKSMCL